MQHPDLTSQLARERQSRYRTDAGESRMTRLDRTDRATSAGNGDSGEPSFGRVAVARRSAILRVVHR